jgi:hypothetical protein
MLEVFVLGCMLAGLSKKECAKLLGERKVEYPKLKRWELVKLAYSAEDEHLRKFFLLCLHGKKAFLEAFFGLKQATPEQRLEWELLVANTTEFIELGKLYRDLQKLKGDTKGGEELKEILAKIEFELKNPDEFPTI